MKNIYFSFRLFTCLILLGIYASPSAQAQSCDGVRYLQDIATTTTKTTVQYGTNTTVAGNVQDLFIDIYTPDGDAVSDRPAIIYAYGGSFIGGTRDDGFVVDFCERYAKKGYVTVALDYRLYDVFQLPDSLSMLDEVVKAVSDVKSVVRHLRKSAAEGNPYGINPDLIYAGGISAGAIATAHAAYIDENTTLPSYVQDAVDNNGGINGNTDLAGDSNMAYSSSIQAVVSMAGALHKAYFIRADSPPIALVQGDADNIVPYNTGFAVVSLGILEFPIVTLQGSGILHPHTQGLGVHSVLYTVAGGDHVSWWYDEPHFSTYDNMIVNFLHDVTCDAAVANEELEAALADINIYPNPAEESITIAAEHISTSYDLTLTDALGRQIRTWNDVEDAQIQINRGNLSSGLYTLTFQMDDAVVSKRIVWR